MPLLQYFVKLLKVVIWFLNLCDNLPGADYDQLRILILDWTNCSLLLQAGEKRDKQLKELKDQAGMKQPSVPYRDDKHNFWENQSFKFIASMSMLALVMLTKR